MSPWHAIQLTSDQFVACTWSRNTPHDVFEVNSRGQVVISYKINFTQRLDISSSIHVIYQFIKTTSVFL
jgi:hypothetical protein